ncbi:MFS permease [Burkholderia thailandensis E264]|uniref:MFS permease n=1 Tax=Burkholderia thailandensis (strain ATCC 700388 / DSM 13276 / CCUG 48851 / CIP 106301 / E264) TaxID=271848 RepID=Q2SZU5_BURTA|nr:MFS permease [Burkholderia thailandensis E264]
MKTHETERHALRALASANFATGSMSYGVVGVLPSLAADWRIAPGRAALLMAAFSIAFALGAPVLQMLIGHPSPARRADRRPADDVARDARRRARAELRLAARDADRRGHRRGRGEPGRDGGRRRARAGRAAGQGARDRVRRRDVVERRQRAVVGVDRAGARLARRRRARQRRVDRRHGPRCSRCSRALPRSRRPASEATLGSLRRSRCSCPGR